MGFEHGQKLFPCIVRALPGGFTNGLDERLRLFVRVFIHKKGL
jgi:hypothetical protein